MRSATFMNKLNDLYYKNNRTLNQFEEYNDIMKSRIAVTLRPTYLAKKNVVNIEKKKQGHLIESINKDIKNLNEQKMLYQAQLISH